MLGDRVAEAADARPPTPAAARRGRSPAPARSGCCDRCSRSRSAAPPARIPEGLLAQAISPPSSCMVSTKSMARLTTGHIASANAAVLGDQHVMPDAGGDVGAEVAVAVGVLDHAVAQLDRQGAVRRAACRHTSRTPPAPGSHSPATVSAIAFSTWSHGSVCPPSNHGSAPVDSWVAAIDSAVCRHCSGVRTPGTPGISCVRNGHRRLLEITMDHSTPTPSWPTPTSPRSAAGTNSRRSSRNSRNHRRRGRSRAIGRPRPGSIGSTRSPAMARRKYGLRLASVSTRLTSRPIGATHGRLAHWRDPPHPPYGHVLPGRGGGDGGRLRPAGKAWRRGKAVALAPRSRGEVRGQGFRP